MIEETYKYISSLDVQLKEEDQNQIGLILPHEHIFQSLSQNVKESEADIDNLTIEQIDSIRANPFRCFRNLNLNSVEEQHYEMQNLPLLPILNGRRLMVVESTNAQKGQDSIKLKEISRLVGVDIVKGFTFGQDISKIDLNDEKTKVLFSAQNILDQIDLEFEMGSGGQKPAFLGELDISELQLQTNIIHQNCMIAYLHLSRVKRVPLIINLNNKQAQECISEIKTKILEEHRDKVVIFNPNFTWGETLVEEINGQFSLKKSLLNFQDIINLLQSKFIVGFDVLRYSNEELKYVIKTILAKYPQFIQQILLSSGVKYRSDLQKYGGRGYFAVFEFIKEINLSEEQIRVIFRENMIKLLDWNSFKLVHKQVQQWTCPQCKKEYPETIEKFQKFGREFCSIQCLKKAVK